MIKLVKESLNEENFIDMYSFKKILPKRSRYNFKQATNKIIDVLENNNVNSEDIKKYLITLIQETTKLSTNPIFMDY